MNEWKPLGQKIFVFTVPETERFEGSLLYKAQLNRGSLQSVQKVWIITPSDRCKHKWKRGECYVISDGFEYDPTKIDLWEQYKDDEAFEELKAYSEKVSGHPEAMMIHELCLQGLVVDDSQSVQSQTDETDKLTCSDVPSCQDASLS